MEQAKKGVYSGTLAAQGKLVYSEGSSSLLRGEITAWIRQGMVKLMHPSIAANGRIEGGCQAYPISVSRFCLASVEGALQLLAGNRVVLRNEAIR
jgi:hypothetical protein